MFVAISACAGGLVDIAGDLARCRTLLLDGRCDRGRDLAHLADRPADTADRLHGLLGRPLDLADLRADLVGGLAVCVASDLTSLATTAKPLPASPARAASIVAFSASRLVWPAIVSISCTTSPMRCAVC